MSLDIINFLIALVICIVMTMLVYRTKKGLDTAFKLYLGMTICLLIAALFQLNQYLGIVPSQLSTTAFKIFCFLSALFFLSGCIKFLNIINQSAAEK